MSPRAERIRNTFERPITAVIVVGAAYVVYLCIRLMALGWDASGFIAAGDQYVDTSKTPEQVKVQANSPGYDGQFYYALAIEPWSDDNERDGVALDKPAYRQQRILYPLIVSALTLGNEHWAPEGLILVNLLAILVGAYLGTRFVAGRKGVLLGIAVGLYPGFLLSTTRDLAEPLAGALIIGSLLSVRKRRFAWATLLLTMAVLTRETTLAVALAAAGVWTWQSVTRSKQRDVPLLFFLTPIGVWIAWQLLLLSDTGTVAVASGGNNLTLPFSGILRAFSEVQTHGGAALARWMAGAALVGLIAVFGLASLKDSSATRTEKLAFALYALLVVTLSQVVWIEDWAFLRAGTELFLLGSIVLLLTPLGQWLRVVSVGLWLILAAVNLY